MTIRERMSAIIEGVEPKGWHTRKSVVRAPPAASLKPLDPTKATHAELERHLAHHRAMAAYHDSQSKHLGQTNTVDARSAKSKIKNRMKMYAHNGGAQTHQSKANDITRELELRHHEKSKGAVSGSKPITKRDEAPTPSSARYHDNHWTWDR